MADIKPGIDLSTILSSYPKGPDFRHPFKGMPFHVSEEKYRMIYKKENNHTN